MGMAMQAWNTCVGKMEAREWGFKVIVYRQKQAGGRAICFFFLSIYFGFFKAIIKKNCTNQYKEVAILEKSLKENIPLELNFQNFC